MEVWMLSLVISGCLALPGIPTPHHPGQELIDLAIQTNLKGQTRIIGGTDAYINDFPWQASLEFNGQHICGAIILSTEFILTAAHCMGSDTWNYKIHVGSSSLSSTGGSRHSVSAAVLHEHFVNSGSTTNGAFPNDVALIKLSEPIDFTSNKQPIDLTSLTNNNLASNDDCWITGWGRTNGNSNTPLPDQLQKTPISVLTDAHCLTYLGSALSNDIHICVIGDGSNGGCNGDSGGPLVCKVGNEYELAGVTSFVFGSCLTYYPTVYAETHFFRSWIQNKMDSMK